MQRPMCDNARNIKQHDTANGKEKKMPALLTVEPVAVLQTYPGGCITLLFQALDKLIQVCAGAYICAKPSQHIIRDKSIEGSDLLTNAAFRVPPVKVIENEDSLEAFVRIRRLGMLIASCS